MSISCPYCQAPATYYASSAPLFNGRDYGACWACVPCDAQVGCNDDGTPAGTLANRALRSERRKVRQIFDPLWQDVHRAYPGIPLKVGHVRQIMRTRAHEWLAYQMKLPVHECHISKFDQARCRWAVQIIESMKPNAATIRQWAKDRETA